MKVVASKGETVRQILVESELLDIECRIVSEDGSLYFPLRVDTTIEMIERVLVDHEVQTGERDFPLLPSGPRTLEEVLKDRIPSESLALLPRAYDLIGDIAVLEIPEELAQYEQMIGEAFRLVHKSFATVLAKRGAISGTKRTRKYDLLAGEDRTNTIHTEYGVRIAVDLAVAYFSPRLLEEHNRVAFLVEEGESIIDMFTGVGPFALHIAKRCDANVVAVDHNFDAIRLLKESMSMNRLIGTIVPVVSDTHEYVQLQSAESVDRVIMNHPSGAAEFVADACFVLRPRGVLHYYDFMGGDDPIRSLKEKITEHVENAERKVSEITVIRRVRDSAPHEYQMVADVIIH